MARSLQWPFQERVSSQTGSSLNPGSMTPFEQTGIEIMLIFGRGCMNRTLITVSLTFFSAVMTKAQSEFIPTNLPLTSVQPLQLIPVPGKPHLVESPYSPGKYIDVEGFPPGTEVKDPYTDKIFLVP